MFFGFVMAAVAGFLLTAIPNWTQRRPFERRASCAVGRSVAPGTDRLSVFDARPAVGNSRGRSVISRNADRRHRS